MGFPEGGDNAEVRRARAAIERIIARSVQKVRSEATGVPGLKFAYLTEPMRPTAHVFEFGFCIGIRGAKRIWLNERVHEYDEDRFLLTTIGLPTIAEVADAALDNPYVAVGIDLDMGLTRAVAAEIDISGRPTMPDDAAMIATPINVSLLDVVHRYARLVDAPEDIAVLGPLLRKEIHYRLLVSPVGARLRQMSRLGSNHDRVGRAARWLRDHIDERISMHELAERCGLGLSTLNRRFQQMTGMSPLQYQKQLRLHEARRILFREDVDAASVAYRVGYESATQFSREYRRLFGDPPIRDVRLIQKLRTIA